LIHIIYGISQMIERFYVNIFKHEVDLVTTYMKD